jgi:hypothetical protein
VLVALGLAPEFDLVNDPSQADVLVLNGVIPDPQTMRLQVQRGAGMVLILGSELAAREVGALFEINASLELREDPLSLLESRQASDPVLDQVVWNSAPQVRRRVILQAPGLDLLPLVSGYEDGELVLGRLDTGGGTVFILTPFLDDSNPQFQSWAYFNYLVYHLAARAAGLSPDTFADYPGSPVPHARERLILFSILGVALLTAILIFIFVRRYSLAHPEALDELVANQSEFVSRQVGTGWEEIGFHRPLGGFMLAFMLGLVLFIPLIIYQNMILPVFILPSAQAIGIWGRVLQFFEFLWLLLDMGTSAAFIKFFAQYRVHDPRKAIQYGQVFVWWQALSGAVQVAVMTAVGGILVPHTVYALYAWSIIIHTFIQIPGFFLVMRHALMGWQRFDYAQILDMGWKLVFPMIAQPVIVLLMVNWARGNPVLGTAMGGLLGLGIAAYASEAMTFLLGLFLYKRMGYNARVLFMAHFDWATIKSAFRFGVFEMMGSVAWAVGQAVEILITQTRLINYTEIWGNWVLA